MAVYAVFLNETNDGVWQALQDQWPNGRNFILTDHMAFVAPEGIVTTAQISEAVGIGRHDDGEVLGIVFEWGAHGGYNRSDLWEWLGKVQS